MRSLQKILLITIAILGITGCSVVKDKPLPRSEADKKFISILENDYSYKPVIRQADQTLWIYLAMEEPLYKTIAGQDSPPIKRKYTLEFIEGLFKEKDFFVEYDVIDATKVAGGSGLSMRYTDEFNTRYLNLITAISRAYFTADKPPEFIVLVIADVKNGIEIEQKLFLDDLKKYSFYALPPDEYNMRVLTEAKGDTKIIGDFKGQHLEPKSVVWPNFLTKQIAQRARYKFQNSDFPPEETPKTEILKIIAKTFMIYEYKNFDALLLTDLRAKAGESFTRTQIETMYKDIVPEKEVPKGKVVTVDFSELGKEKEKEEVPEIKLQPDEEILKPAEEVIEPNEEEVIKPVVDVVIEPSNETPTPSEITETLNAQTP